MDAIDIARYFGALTLVLALIGLAWLAARRFGLPGVVGPSGTRRLSMVETLMVGPKHRLCLLRRDGVEHLVLIGPDGATTVESGIAPPPPLPEGSQA
ncbi:MAG: flagellar biosynthetic protein FliO [Alphaproteobacteria bacterium]|nr:flagellar biosynthetic protein FliO [Alphaproteobacteria bacterium]MBU6471027.1 flagellar biosynthetic protein FliO [Alphaproteobacteria bacterium]MDE2012219.1 FliO/MopB family protein [Alphaproteobacteria bacterium]MDE2074864.1 FliO/MopB family protein [Alphaproteobacteria bacterium]MDE2351478.1 FliO/MopB family protein [Alphaproteobacteria bacterium]